MSGPKDYRVGEVVVWFRMVNPRNYRRTPARVKKVMDRRITLEVEDPPGEYITRHVTYEYVEKVKPAQSLAG